MKAKLCFVPPGGGEEDFHLELDLPGVPNPGDYIVVVESDKLKSGDDYQGLHQGYIVRRCWWWIKDGKYDFLVVEAEFAVPWEPTKDHQSALVMYQGRGKKARDMEWT